MRRSSMTTQRVKLFGHGDLAEARRIPRLGDNNVHKAIAFGGSLWIHKFRFAQFAARAVRVSGKQSRRVFCVLSSKQPGFEPELLSFYVYA